jgi:membrane protease YdiL (CAAX protease family)
MLLIIPGSLVVSTIVLIAVAVTMGGSELISEDGLTSWIQEVSSTRLGLLVLIAPGQAFFLCTAFGLAALSSEPTLRRLGIVRTRGSMKTWTLLALGTPVVQFGSLLFAGLFFDTNEPSEQLQMIGGLITSQSGFIGISLVFLLAAISPGLSEELFFRGFVRVGLSRRYRFFGAIFIPAFMFAAVHMDPMHATAVFPLGLWFGCLAWWSGSTLPAIGAHLVNNFFAIILALQASALEIDPHLLEAAEATPAVENLSLMTLLGYGAGFLFLLAGLSSLKRDQISTNTD